MNAERNKNHGWNGCKNINLTECFWKNYEKIFVQVFPFNIKFQVVGTIKAFGSIYSLLRSMQSRSRDTSS